LQFSGVDCNNNAVNLFNDLDAGKAVVLFFYMPNCGSCPPPALQIQTMANNVMATYPGMVKGYAFPYQNSTTCAYSISWVTNNGLSFYAPMDSGATPVAYYGGFGMPTVVLVGGADHRVMWSTQSFGAGDTTIMRDSILNLLGPAGLNPVDPNISSVNVFPNPANEKLQVEMNITNPVDVKFEVVNLLGEVVLNVYNSGAAPGLLRKEISTAELSNGAYFVRVTSGDNVQNHKFSVAH
jgi:hypothetical protein